MTNYEKILEQITAHAADYALRIVAAILIFYFGKYIAKFLSRVAHRGMKKTHMDETLAGFLKNVIYAMLFAVVIIASLNSLGVQTTSLVAVMGAAGLAVGLSLKDQVANFGAGVLIVMLRPFKVGDIVTTAGQTGSVLTIQVFQTILKTFDNLTIMIPNSNVMNGEIINFSLQGTRMIPLVIGISYGNDIKKAKDIMLETMSAHEKVLKDPAPSAGVLELADSSVNLFARSWVETGDWWNVKADLLEDIKINLTKGGISIPYPQMDIYIHKPEEEA
ncbi:mechanosensitive ion channel [Geovibrio thiophilus]|uniref:Mechanosensitive ion channel n=1 Tax=Geovibrio thiophilus TaxID=139438 RepID=A0A410JVU8_9BACT|nr:mechanosensitive ion channel domain-containing protein [Geovibrio thiophilus]QAR32155.1 mechanosensitive ion channel [Geovibrio thiophilus]